MVQKQNVFLYRWYEKRLHRATWNTFIERYTENKPEEERTIQKALEHFDKFNTKPYNIVQQQDGTNHREMLHDAKLSNGETIKD